jgi:HSP20 family protein
MALVRWDPFPDLDDLSVRLGRFGGWMPRRAEDEMAGFFSGWTPAVDVEENDKEYLVKADLPEVKKSDVKVNIQDGMLVIEGERQQGSEEKGKKFHRVERSYGKFVRRLTVPADVERDKVAADYKDGVLAVHLPKAEQAVPASKSVKIG